MRPRNVPLYLKAAMPIARTLTAEPANVLGTSEFVTRLEALRDLTSPRALVVRDGKPLRIPGRDVVRGDLIVVGEGDRVPADAVILSGDHIMTDESLLTGESAAVSKKPSPAPLAAAARPGGEGLPFIYAGSLVVRGDGRALVVATGSRSEIGKIGLALSSIEAEQPRLRRQTRDIVRLFAFGALLFTGAVVVLNGFLYGDWLKAFLGGIALGMSLLPEEFPLVLAVFTVMGAWRISKARVLTRRAAAIETLGAATVLCTDKTGTLTRNKMSIVRLWRPGVA
jgi:Ca2+-transporting ATPase